MRFRYKNIIHIKNIGLVLICFGTNFFDRIGFEEIPFVSLALSIGALYVLVSGLITKFTISEEGIKCRSLIENTYLDWNDVEAVFEVQSNKSNTPSVLVCGLGKKICISSWIKDQADLLDLVLKSSRLHESIEVDRRVALIIAELRESH